MNDFKEFCDNFSIVDNAVQMRNMIRWNGRDVRNKENLAEHTHLVVACAIDIVDRLPGRIKYSVNYEHLVKRCMYHDSLELLRGDILSVTKDIIPGLREWTNNEENEFMNLRMGNVSDLTMEIVELADLMTCYKFIESELRFPSNDFVIDVYKTTKKKYDDKWSEFKIKYDIPDVEGHVELDVQFSKGYEADAGIDVILSDDITFMPHSTTYKSLGVKFTPGENEMGMLCARTSAANKGLIVGMSPIDANYEGYVTAIVHNMSNHIITYKKGESFCQLVKIPVIINNEGVTIRKMGKRTDGKFGSTDVC